MLIKLRKLQAELKQLRKDVKAIQTSTIGRKSILNKAESIGSLWFSEYSDALTSQHGLPPDTIESYSQYFGRLIKISGPNNPKKSYTDTLGSILQSFRNDLVIPLQTSPKGASKVSLLGKLLEDLPSPSENEYLKEAVDCARHDFLRASAVLGWCAAVDRIHHAIEKEGFAKFNVASATMASQTKGRFKKFNSVQNVTSVSELRLVFDTVVLWIIEGMGLIDVNQHTRLRSCFDLRCQCGHPGDAPVTEYNLLSYFSDLNEIVFKNAKFKMVG